MASLTPNGSAVRAQRGMSGNYDAANDELYQQMYNSLKGTPYGDLIAMIPSAHYDYRQTIGDSLGNVFGWNTTEDKLRLQMQQDTRNQLYQIASLKFENDYNSEAAKVQRMRDAGENPDLLGTGGVSEAAEMTEPDRPDVSGIMSEPQSKFAELARGIMDIMNAGFGFAERFTSLEQMKQNIEFGRDQQARSIAELVAPALYREFDLTPGQSIEGITDDEINSVLKKNFPSFLLYREGSKKRQDMDDRIAKYVRITNNGIGAKEKYHSSISNIIDSKVNAADKTSKTGIGLDEGSDVAVGLMNILNEGYKEMYQAEINARKSKADLQSAQADYDKEYLQNADPALAAERLNSDNQEQIDYNNAFNSSEAASAQNATNAAVKAAKGTEEILNSMTEQVFSYLKNKADSGNKFATGCLTAFCMFRFLSMSNMMPSVKASSSSGLFGDKSSFSLGF